MLSVQICRTHRVSAVLQLCRLAQFKSSRLQENVSCNPKHVTFSSLPAGGLIQGWIWLKSNHARVWFESDREQLAQTVLERLFWSTLVCECRVFTCIKKRTHEENTPQRCTCESTAVGTARSLAPGYSRSKGTISLSSDLTDEKSVLCLFSFCREIISDIQYMRTPCTLL